MKHTAILPALGFAILMAGAPLQQSYAANPILPMWEYIPDGEPYVFEDPDNPGKFRVYLYGSHDNLVTEYCGRDQVVWSAPIDNLNEWRFDGVIFTSTRDANGNLLYANGQGDVLYAPDVAEVIDSKGKKTYYLYPNNQAWGRNGMVAKASRPDGPFEVCNWDPENPKHTVGDLRFDPGVLVDGDKVYAYWGFEDSNGAELDPSTMATIVQGTLHKDLIPSSKQEGVFRFFEASSMRKIKDKYVLVYSRVTSDGEFGLPATNYTLAYAYSDSPMGPFTYGGTIIDGRGREKGKDGKTVYTAHPFGNTHGSIIEINGQWYVFYHRQCGTTEYNRQAMVAPIEVNVTEGPGGKVEISEGEYTSEGFELGGLNPLERHSAGIACHYTGPEGTRQSYPNYYHSGSYVEALRPKINEGDKAYDLRINHGPVVNNTSGSVVGYKYFNFDHLGGKKAKLLAELIPAGIAGGFDVLVDNPYTGRRIGSADISGLPAGKPTEISIDLSDTKNLKGKHALYFVFKSPAAGQSVCTLNNFVFTVE